MALIAAAFADPIAKPDPATYYTTSGIVAPVVPSVVAARSVAGPVVSTYSAYPYHAYPYAYPGVVQYV